MGWFSDQIKERMDRDKLGFTEALEKMAYIVMDAPDFATTMGDTWEQSQFAIEKVLQYYGKKYLEHPKGAKNLDQALDEQLQPYGMMRRNVTLKDEWYLSATGAMLGRKKTGEILAFIPEKRGGYCYYEKATHKKVPINGKNAQDFAPEALCFYQPFPLKSMTMKDLVGYISKIPSKDDKGILVALTLFVTMLGLLLPKINHFIFSTVVFSTDVTLLLATMVLFLGISVTKLLLELIKNLFLYGLKIKMELAVESATMMRVLALPLDFFRKYSPGNLFQRMDSVGKISGIFIDCFLSVGLTSLFSVIYLVQIFQYARPLLLPALVVLVALLILTITTAVVSGRLQREFLDHSANESGLVFAFLNGISKIKLAGAEKRAFAKWADAYEKEATCLYRPPHVIPMSPVYGTIITFFGSVAMYYMAVSSGISAADYMTFSLSFGMLTGNFMALSAASMELSQVYGILHLAEPILQAVPEISERKKIVPKLLGHIELNNVYFKYEGAMDYLLGDFNLNIKPGQYVAIVGKTGCGKSTLMRILLGFETPEKGAIYYDGKSLQDLDLKSLRQNIGVVSQNGKLFSGDIFSNIVASAPSLTLEDAWTAARLAGIEDDIKRMPMGMQTLLTQGGGGISGGQRQRLLIARAIAHKPNILMFDEATSALDNLTQKIVTESLNSLKCTKIVIAHRLSTIQQCDRIIVLDQGKIVEDGTYEDLVNRQGFFAELVQRQMGE